MTEQTPETLTDDYVEVYRDDAGELRWRYKSANNVDILADSGEGYRNQSDLLAALGRVTQRTPTIVETKGVHPDGLGLIRVVMLDG